MLINCYDGTAGVFATDATYRHFKKDYAINTGAILYFDRNESSLMYVVCMKPRAWRRCEKAQPSTACTELSDEVVQKYDCWLATIIKALDTACSEWSALHPLSIDGEHTNFDQFAPTMGSAVQPHTTVVKRSLKGVTYCLKVVFRISYFDEEWKMGRPSPVEAVSGAILIETADSRGKVLSPYRVRDDFLPTATDVAEPDYRLFLNFVAHIMRAGIASKYFLLEVFPIFQALGLQFVISTSGTLVAIRPGFGMLVSGGGTSTNGFFLRLFHLISIHQKMTLPLDRLHFDY